MNPFAPSLSHTHTYVSTHIHYPPPSPPSPHSRGCWSEKLNFSDEKVFPAPIPLLPFSPPIHSLIYSLIYELLIYSLREKLTVVQLSVRAAAVFAMEDHRANTNMTPRSRSKQEEGRRCISAGAAVTVHQLCVGSSEVSFGFNCCF